MRKIGHLHHILLFIFAFYFPIHNIRLQPAPEIRGAHNGVDDGEDDQNNCDHCERSESLASRYVALGPCGILVHSNELKEEVAHSSNV